MFNWKLFGLNAVIATVFAFVGAIALNGRNRLTNEWSIERGFSATFGLLGGFWEVIILLAAIGGIALVAWLLLRDGTSRNAKIIIGAIAFVVYSTILYTRSLSIFLPGSGGVVAILVVLFIAAQAAALTLVARKW